MSTGDRCNCYVPSEAIALSTQQEEVMLMEQWGLVPEVPHDRNLFLNQEA